MVAGNEAETRYRGGIVDKRQSAPKLLKITLRLAVFVDFSGGLYVPRNKDYVGSASRIGSSHGASKRLRSVEHLVLSRLKVDVAEVN